MSTSAIEVHAAPTTLAESARLRAIAPVVRVRTQTGLEAWAVLSHELAKQALSDPRLGREKLITSGNLPYRTAFPSYLQSTLLFQDDPHHARLRRVAAKWFTSRRVERLRARTIVSAERLLDAVEAAGPPADLMTGFAEPLPIDVLLDLLGLDKDMAPTFLRWSRDLLATGGRTPEQIETSLQECRDFLRTTIEERRVTPDDALLSALAEAPTGENGLTDAEILNIAMLILIAGFDNTANTIGSGIHALLLHPDQMARVVADPDGMAQSTSEEILRHGRQSTGPEQQNFGVGVPFVANESFEFGGVEIQEGDFVMVNRNSASHDGTVFADPDELDVTRAHNPHLGLSHGIHHCLGAPLARMELQVAFAAVFKRFPTLRLLEKPTYHHQSIAQSMASLKVSW